MVCANSYFFVATEYLFLAPIFASLSACSLPLMLICALTLWNMVGHNPITYNLVRQSLVKLLSEMISYSNNLLRQLRESEQEYANRLLPL